MEQQSNTIAILDWREDYYPEAIKSVQEAICREYQHADEMLNRGNRRRIALDLYFKLV